MREGMPDLSRIRDPRVVKSVLLVLAAAYAIAHLAALFTDSFNWDELALLHRAQHALLTGQLQAGGRPGLGVLAVIPFVDGCEDHMVLARTVRLAWAGFTLALLAGLFVFLRIATRRSAGAWHAAALGTAALALVPLFLRWSLQVRTDQPAVAAVLWGGVALLASRDRRSLAVLAGALVALGYLFSQKAIYVAALVGVVALGDLYIERAFAWRREAVRAVGFVVGAVAVLALYAVIVPRLYAPPRVMSLDAGLDLFRWYRYVLRFRLYGAIVPAVIPHLVLLALIFFAALRAFRDDGPERRPLLVALVVLVLGVAVARFHTASFPYFWITIGVFPATAIAIGWAGVRDVVGRLHLPLALVLWGLMIALAVKYRAETLRDTQRPQAETFALLDRHAPPAWRGFHPDGALVCRRDPSPFPVYLGQHITSRFGGNDQARKVRAFLDEFSSRPVAFLVRTPRMAAFPSAINQFWQAHYVPYVGSVEVAGRRVEGPAGTRLQAELLIAGTYRWWVPGGVRGRIAIDGRRLAHGETIALAAGAHAIELVDAVAGGTLALALDAPPRAAAAPFYDGDALAELSSVRRTWWRW